MPRYNIAGSPLGGRVEGQLPHLTNPRENRFVSAGPLFHRYQSRWAPGAFRAVGRGRVCSPGSRRVDSTLMADVTQILAAAEAGDPTAAAELLPLVYDELRRLAAARLAAEKPGQTLQPTALVHEAYLRLVGGAQ